MFTWCRAFIRFHGLRHPSEMGKEEVEAFLTHLAAERCVAPSTHRQALSALLFLYGKVLEVQLPWMVEIGRPVPKRRLPVVLSADEVATVLARMEGEHALMARLLYGTGLRIAEGLRLRVKDLDVAQRAISRGGRSRTRHRIRFNGKERKDVKEYCISEGWIKQDARGQDAGPEGPALAAQDQDQRRGVLQLAVMGQGATALTDQRGASSMARQQRRFFVRGVLGASRS